MREADRRGARREAPKGARSARWTARGRPPVPAAAILAAAGRRVARFGPHKTTMAEIARDAGCSRATLYARFPSKEALYGELLEGETRRFLGEVERVAASAAPARRKLHAIATAALRVYEDSPLLRDAWREDEVLTLRRVARPSFAAYAERVVAVLRRTLEEGISAGELRAVDAEATARLVFELGRVVVTGEYEGRRLPLRRLLAGMDDLFDRGLRAAAPRRAGR